MRFKIILLAAICLLCTTLIQADVVLQDLQKNKIHFSSLRGKWVFINYWASWCQPCLDEIPELNEFYFDNKSKVMMFGVNFDALPVEQQKALARQYQLKYPSLRQDPASSLKLGDIRGVPMTFVFNPQGQLFKVLTGSQTKQRLTRLITTN